MSKSEAEQRRIATAAPAELKFADGTTYTMSRLSDLDIAELDTWVQQYYLCMVRASLEDVSNEEKERVERLATLTALSLTWMSGPGASLLASVRGMTRMVWQTVKKVHPDVTEDELRSHMLSPENIGRAQALFHELNVEDKKGAKKRRQAREKAKEKKNRKIDKERKRRLRNQRKKGCR